MAVDILIPNDNEEALIAMAKKLGYSEIIFLYKKPLDKSFSDKKIVIKKAFYSESIKDFDKVKDFDLFFAPAKREFFESKKPFFLTDAEIIDYKDSFHQRRSGLDEVMANLAFEKEKTVVFNISLFSGSDIVFGRMMQNARLCRKYNVKTLIASFAKNPLELRAPKDIEGLKRILKII
jgi:RNase P/RNase MRP subunit p30